MIAPIVVGLLLLVALVLAFMSSKVWHWGHVLVVVGLILSTAGFLVLASESLRVQTKHLAAAEEAQRQLDETLALSEVLKHGTRDPALIGKLAAKGVEFPEGPEGIEEATGIVDLEHRLALVTRQRGRAWEDVAPVGPPGATGDVTVAVEEGAPRLDFGQGSVVYVFEQGDAPAQYLGEFRVQQTTGAQAVLAPATNMDQRDARRLIESAGGGRRWVVLENMPVDTHELFAGVGEEELRKAFPPEVVVEYLRDGKPAAEGDDPFRVMGIDEEGNVLGPENMDKAVKRVYSRRLRDYVAAFSGLRNALVVGLAEVEALKDDTARLADAGASALRLKAFREDEQRRLDSDRQQTQRDQRVAQAYLAQLTAQVAKAGRLLEETLSINLGLSQAIADRQQSVAGGDLQNRPVPSRGALDSAAL